MKFPVLQKATDSPPSTHPDADKWANKFICFTRETRTLYVFIYFNAGKINSDPGKVLTGNMTGNVS